MKFYIGSGLKNDKLVSTYAKKLEENGWMHTFDWTKYSSDDITMGTLCELAELEQKGIEDADVVVILLPAGRGTYVELGMALAHHKQIFLCAAAEEEFSMKNMVSFYQLPGVVKLVGTMDEHVKEITSARIKQGDS